MIDKQKLMSISAGRELDIEIAEFMGGEWFYYDCSVGDHIQHYNGIVTSEYHKNSNNFLNLIEFNKLKYGKSPLENVVFGAYMGENYSSDLLQAWKVAEKFPIVNVQYVEIFEGFPSYKVEMPRENGTTEFQCRSLPLAICKCALFSLMEVS